MLWFILFFAPAAFGATEWWSRAVLESLIFILAAMCALRRDFFAPLNGPLIGFGVIIGLGILQLAHARPLTRPAGLLPFTLSRPQTLYALHLWTALAALFWSASGILRWEGALRRVSWAIFGIGFFIAIVGILQRGQGNTAYYGLRPIRDGRPFGPFTNYDHAATWMVASTFVGAGLFAGGGQRSRVPLTERVAQQTLIAFVLIVLIAAVLETGSRGGVNALFSSALAAAFLAAGSLVCAWPRRLVRGGLLLAGCAYGFFLCSNPKWLGLSDGALDASAAYRVSMYRSGLRMLVDFPMYGVGLGCFASAFHPYQEKFVVGLVDHVHSSWLEITLETGFLGIAAFGSVVLSPLVSIGRRLRRPDFPGGMAAAGCFAAVLAVILHGFVEFSFQIPADAILLVVLLAAIAVSEGIPPTQLQAPVRFLRLMSATVFAVLALLSLPPGISGMAPRFGYPFVSENNRLIDSHLILLFGESR